MTLKANKQELFSVDNKFRLYAKKEKFKKFVEETEMDCHDLKVETKTLNRTVDTLVKSVHADIQNTVRRATAHLKENKVENPLAGVDTMLQEAHLEH